MPSLAITSRSPGRIATGLDVEVRGIGIRRCRRPGVPRTQLHAARALATRSAVTLPIPTQLQRCRRRSRCAPTSLPHRAFRSTHGGTAESPRPAASVRVARRQRQPTGRGCRGLRTVTETVDHAEQRSAAADLDGDRLVTARLLLAAGATPPPIRWVRTVPPVNCQAGSISTSRSWCRGRVPNSTISRSISRRAPGRPRPEAAAGRVAVLERSVDVGDAGPVVLCAHHERLPAVPVLHTRSGLRRARRNW